MSTLNYQSNDYYFGMFSESGNMSKRMSQPKQLFQNRFSLDDSPLSFVNFANTGGTVSHLANKSGVRLSIDTTNNAQLQRQTRRYFQYTPGETVRFSGGIIFGDAVNGVSKRAGMYDDSNGWYWQYNGNGMSVVRRSGASGSVVNTSTNQTEWNIDKMDGTGPSQLILDWSKIQMVYTEYSWYGAGYVLFGVQHRKKIFPVHIIQAGNILSEPIFGSATLPLRYELEADGVTDGGSMDIFGGAVSSEGHIDRPPEFTFSTNNGIAARTISSRTPILSIRPKLLFNSVVNRAAITPFLVETLVATNNCLIEVTKGGTLTNASFVSVNANSVVERDVAATSITGERVVSSFYASTTQGNKFSSFKKSFSDIVPITVDPDGNDSTIFSIVVTPITGSADILSAVEWSEIK